MRRAWVSANEIRIHIKAIAKAVKFAYRASLTFEPMEPTDCRRRDMWGSDGAIRNSEYLRG